LATKIHVSPRKLPKQDRSNATVEAIVEATTRILEHGGVHKITTNRIAEVAGVSIGSLYQYFPNKEALMLEVAKRHSATMLRLLADKVQDLQDAPIPVAVRSYVNAMLKAHSVNPQLHQALIHQVLHLGLEHFQELETAARALVRTYLAQNQDEILCADLELAAFVLVTAVEALTQVATLQRPEDLKSGVLEDEMVSFILRYLGVEESP